MKKIVIVLLSLVSFSTFAQEQTDKKILQNAVNQIQNIAGDTIEEGEFRIKILISKSKCYVRPATGKYSRYYCRFEIRVTETAVKPYNIIDKGCEINFFTTGGDLSTLKPNEGQLNSCFEYHTSGD